MSLHRFTLVAALCALLGSERAYAQCVAATTGFGAPGIPIAPRASLVFDDGSGDELFVAGSFLTAGEITANGIAKWNGSRWAALGSGVDEPPMLPLYGFIPAHGVINALAAFDDGSGLALYAGGKFTSIGGVSASNLAKWNGSAWSAVGGGVQQEVLALQAFDDGSGPALFVGGDLQSAGGNAVSHCARWDGSTWTNCGGAIQPVRALRVFDDGSGPALYGAAVWNSPTGGTPVAKWNGSSWSSLGSAAPNMGYFGYALEVFDDGGGPALYVGVRSYPWAPALWRWTGTAWTPIYGFTSSNSLVDTLRTYDDGSGAALYVGGTFSNGSIASLARWTGSGWSSVGASSGLEFNPEYTYYDVSVNRNVTALTVFDDGAGSRLYACGELERADGANVSNIARYDASGWSALTVSNAPTHRVTALHSFDDGNGEQLYAAGTFKNAGPVDSPSLARWNGSSWSAMGVTLSAGDWIRAVTDYDSGSGPELYIGGNFATLDDVAMRRVARWNGTSWSPLGTGLAGNTPMVLTFAVYDDGAGEGLYAAGRFSTAGGLTANNIAKWNGSSWSTLGSGLGHNAYAAAVFDSGSGEKLYVGGHFSIASGISASRIAAWNGSTWSALGPGLDDDVQALAVHDDGSGPALYAGGEFIHAGSTFAAFVARWNGTSWSPVGVVPSAVYSLHSFDYGGGRALYAVARNTFNSEQLLRWNGVVWTQVAEIAGTSYALDSLDAGLGRELYLGGLFSLVSEPSESNLARFVGACTCPLLPYCTAGTSSNGCVPTISASGTASASGSGSFIVTANGVEGQKIGLLFYGVSGASAAPWGATSSFLCLKPPQQRTGQQSTGGTPGACDGALVLDFNAYVASHPSALGQPFGVGDTVRMQGWYRDPPNPKTTSLTDALEFYVCP